MPKPMLEKQISVTALTNTAVSIFAASNLLLLHFLSPSGTATLLSLLAATALIALLIFRKVPTTPQTQTIPATTLAGCVVISLLVMLLGGQGSDGLLYRNIDWQVRATLLQDLATMPWPFHYQEHGINWILRAPIGMYLIPASMGNILPFNWVEAALLIQNTSILSITLALASTIFRPRELTIAAVIFVAFSGLDALGTLITSPEILKTPYSHLEWWAAPLQYSSNITLAFWVPNHALPGWLGAILFLLWHKNKASSQAFILFVPLTALWSPLTLLGLLPFAGLVLYRHIASRHALCKDIIAGLIGSSISAVALAYLLTAPESVGISMSMPPFALYMLFQSLEVLPFIALLWLIHKDEPNGRILTATVAGTLLLSPLIRIGIHSDFMMRASIPSLAILTYATAQALARSAFGDDRLGPPMKTKWAIILLAGIGSITPLHEIYRSIRFLPPPLSQCNLLATWNQTAFSESGKYGYFAQVDALPAWMQTVKSAAILSEEPRPCWNREWNIPR